MIDIVIPYSSRSLKHTELIFALRSIEKYLSGYRNIFIVGQLPPCISGIIHIPMEEDVRSRFRDRNIMLKILKACKDQRVSDNFLMWHDDHMLLKSIYAADFPTVHHGIMNPGPGQYGETKQNTMRKFGERINDYDSHCPILFNKELFISSVPTLNWQLKFGFCIKTAYCLMNGIEGSYYEDLKIRHIPTRAEIYQAIAGRLWFSTFDKCFDGSDMREVLEELYPEPSKYELKVTA